MNHQRVFEHFKKKILDLGIKGISAADIQIPNEYFPRKDRNLFFEITLGEGEPENYTEEADLRNITVDIDVVAPAGATTQRLNAIVEKVRRFYSPKSSKKSGFRIDRDLFLCRKVVITPVMRQSRFQMDHTTEGVKVCVKFVFDLYSMEK